MGMSREAAARPHPPTWIAGGVLLLLSTLPTLVQMLGWLGLPIAWEFYSVIAQVGVLLFPLGLAILAVGLRQEDSVVLRQPLGVVALFMVGLTEILLMMPALAGMTFTLIMLKAAAAFVAVMSIWRLGTLPLMVRRLGMATFVVTAISFAAVLILPQFVTGDAGIPLSIYVLVPLAVLAKVALLALGISIIAARRTAP